MSGGATGQGSIARRAFRVAFGLSIGLVAPCCGVPVQQQPQPRPRTSTPVAKPVMDAAANALPRRDDGVQVTVGALRMSALVVPGDSALQTAARLRHAAPAVRQYPVIIGEFGRSVEYLESIRFTRSPREILEASTMVHLDPALWVLHQSAPASTSTELRVLLEEARQYSAAERQQILAATDIPRAVLPRGEFIGHQNLSTGEPFQRVLVLLLPTSEGWQAPAYLGFGGAGGCPWPEQHTRLLRHWHDTYGAHVVTVGANTLELAVERPPQNPAAALELARVQYDYCPTIAKTRGSTLGAMAAAVMQLRVWRFRWD